MENPVQFLARALAEKQPAVLATVVSVSGACPAKPGAQLVLLPDGNTAGTVGGGKLEASIIADAQASLISRAPSLQHYKLAEEGLKAIGTLCGGEVDVFIQPYLPAAHLVIVGGGHIGRPLKVMGEAAGFLVDVVDVEPGRADIPQLVESGLSESSFVVLITTDHISDEAALRIALNSPAPYIGMIGSLAKCRTILEHLRADQVSESDLGRIYAPIGLDLGGSSPQEIAVAILAEVIAVKSRCAGYDQPLRSRRLPELS